MSTKPFAISARLAPAALLVAVLGGCSPSGGATPLAPPSSTILPLEAPSATASSAPSVAPSPTQSGAMALNVGCSDQAPCRLAAGTWVLTGQFSFILGMEVTVPDGWQSLEQDAGEFNLVSVANPGDRIFMVKDIAPVKTDGSMAIAADVPRTVAGLTDYWTHDPNLDTSKPASAQIAGGLDATTFVIRIDDDARYIDKECPAYPRCADLFTDPVYWDGPPYGIGAPEVVRLYLAIVGGPGKPHLLIVGLQAEDDEGLERLERDAAPIIESLLMPKEIVTW